MNKIADKLRAFVKMARYDVRKLSNVASIAVEASSSDVDIIRDCGPYTMTSAERLWALINAVDYTIRAGIPGDYVECGVWRGGSAMAIARKLLVDGITDRTIWLYDTFSGMTTPSQHDKETRSGLFAEQLLASASRTDKNGVWCIASKEDVERNLYATGYPNKYVKFIQGDVMQTLQKWRPEQIALLRLDTDWYESTRSELEALFPKLSIGGVCIIDDYGHWEGARKAVDEYLRDHNLRLLLNRIDSTGRIFIKT